MKPKASAFLNGSATKDKKHVFKRVALIGLGRQGTKIHLPLISNHPDLQLNAVVDIDSSRVKNVSQRFRVPGFASVEAMLSAKTGIDFAIVATSHNSHAGIVEKLAKSGVHILKEKPVTLSLEDYGKMKEVVASSSSILAVVSQRRFDPRYQLLKEKLGTLGAISKFEFLYTMNIKNLDRGWRARKEDAGGGALIDMGYHMVDLVIYLFGRPTSVQSVMANNGRLGEVYETEDTSMVLFKYQGEGESECPGMIGIMNVSRTGYKKQEKIKVIGQEGSLVLTARSLKVFNNTQGTVEMLDFQVEKETAYKNQLNAFLDAIDKGDASDLPNEFGLHESHIETISAIYQARDENREVTVEEHSYSSRKTKTDYTWPIVTWEMKKAVLDQMNKSLSIYNRSGIIDRFEQSFAKYHGVKYGLLTNSGTSALWSMYAGAGIRKGAEVIVPSYTFFATASPLMHLGATPVFADCGHDGNISLESVKRLFSDKTQAIVVTHMWGIPCNMESISKFAKEKDVLLFEDCSHAHGASINGKLVGSFGDAACWSLEGAKTISGGEGGILLTKNKDIYEGAVIFGHYNKRAKQDIALESRLREYVLTGAGQKLRSHPLAVAIAEQQMTHLDAWLAQKREYAQVMIESLQHIPFLSMPSFDCTSKKPAWYAFVMQFRPSVAPCSLDEFICALSERGLTEVDHPGSTKPIHDLALFQAPRLVLPNLYDDDYAPRRDVSLGNAEDFYENAIKLPVWALPSDVDTVNRYISTINEVSDNLMLTKGVRMSERHLGELKALLEQAKHDGIEKLTTGGLVTNLHNQVLVVKRRADDFMPNIYELPGGTLEDGESIVECVVRELEEETGIRFSSVEDLLPTFDYRSNSGKKTRQFSFVLIVPDNFTITLSPEHVDYKWVSAIEDIPDPGVTSEVQLLIKIYQERVANKRF